MIYRGHVRGGVIVLDAPAELPEGTVVDVSPLAGPEADERPDPMHRMGALAVDAGPAGRPSDLPEDSGEPAPEDADNPLLRMLDFAVETGIPDLSRNLDHYLYGHPKVEDDQ